MAICSCGLGQMAWGPKMNFTLKNSNCLPNGCVLFLYSKPYILSKNISSGFIAFLLPLAPQTHTILRWNQRLFCLFFRSLSKPVHTQQFPVPSSPAKSEGNSETNSPHPFIHGQIKDNLQFHSKFRHSATVVTATKFLLEMSNFTHQ